VVPSTGRDHARMPKMAKMMMMRKKLWKDRILASVMLVILLVVQDVWCLSGGLENACGLVLLFVTLGKREPTEREGGLPFSRHPRLTTRARLIVFQTPTYTEYVSYIVTMHMHSGIGADCSQPRRRQ
jgi:hypothetical protein